MSVAVAIDSDSDLSSSDDRPVLLLDSRTTRARRAPPLAAVALPLAAALAAAAATLPAATVAVALAALSVPVMLVR